MVKIERFEDLDTWKHARIFTKEIYEIISKPPFSQDYGLRNQIQRASISVMANIAEGFVGGLIRYLKQKQQ